MTGFLKKLIALVHISKNSKERVISVLYDKIFEKVIILAPFFKKVVTGFGISQKSFRTRHDVLKLLESRQKL